jgi:hypothetical protein
MESLSVLVGMNVDGVPTIMVTPDDIKYDAYSIIDVVQSREGTVGSQLGIAIPTDDLDSVALDENVTMELSLNFLSF